MGESDKKFIGPVTFDAIVHLISEDGRSAKVTVGLAPGGSITRDDVLRAIGQAAEAGEDHGMKPMGPETFFNHVLVKEKTGRIGNFAVPSSMYYELESGVIEYNRRQVEDEDEDIFEDEDE